MVWLDEPVDRTHRESMEAIAWIRKATNNARYRLGLPAHDYGVKRDLPKM